MKVAIGSIFRNSSSYVDRYLHQIELLSRGLNEIRHWSLRPIVVEGDSSDNTYDLLVRGIRRFGGEVVKREHHGPVYGSVDMPARWKALAFCCNGVLENLHDEDALIYVESDLLWDVPTMFRLLDHLKAHDAVAPLCFTAIGTFYDIWGHRKDGVNFGPFPPYHPKLNGNGLVELDSAGSCVVMRGDVARRVRFDEADCIVGLCRGIRQAGCKLMLDPSVWVVHP